MKEIYPWFPAAVCEVHREEIRAAIDRVLGRGQFILGPEVEAFEREFADAIGIGHAVAVANGTDAIELALRALELPPGSRVATVSHTAVATVAAIERAGLEPLLVDIDPGTCTMSPASFARALEEDSRGAIRAVIPVHLYGHPAEMGAIVALARERRVAVVEDCAQSHLATCDGRITGTIGDLAAFSFYPTKNLAALGDGGAVVTRDAAVAARLRALREYGWRDRYISAIPGLNSRLDEIQAAILRVRLARLGAETERRRALADLYARTLQRADLLLPTERPGCTHVYHLYVIRCARRDALLQHLRALGIPAQIHYPAAVHQQPAYASRTPLVAGGLPATEGVIPTLLTLPLHPFLDEAAIVAAGDGVAAFLRR